MMRTKAGVDEGVLHRLGIEPRDLTRRPVQREHLGGGMVGTLLAKVRVVHAAHGGRKPDSPLLVEHTVVVVGPGVPDLLVAPVGRRRERFEAGGVSGPKRFRHVRITHGHLERRHLVCLGIENRHEVSRVFG
jgi:hypothetical protein